LGSDTLRGVFPLSYSSCVVIGASAVNRATKRVDFSSSIAQASFINLPTYLPILCVACLLLVCSSRVVITAAAVNRTKRVCHH
jgi:hypothetical protein